MAGTACMAEMNLVLEERGAPTSCRRKGAGMDGNRSRPYEKVRSSRGGPWRGYPSGDTNLDSA